MRVEDKECVGKWTDSPVLELLVLPTDVDTEALVLHLGWVLFVEIGHSLCVLRVFHLDKTLRNTADQDHSEDTELQYTSTHKQTQSSSPHLVPSDMTWRLPLCGFC